MKMLFIFALMISSFSAFSQINCGPSPIMLDRALAAKAKSLICLDIKPDLAVVYSEQKILLLKQTNGVYSLSDTISKNAFFDIGGCGPTASVYAARLLGDYFTSSKLVLIYGSKLLTMELSGNKWDRRAPKMTSYEPRGAVTCGETVPSFDGPRDRIMNHTDYKEFMVLLSDPKTNTDVVHTISY